MLTLWPNCEVLTSSLCRRLCTSADPMGVEGSLASFASCAILAKWQGEIILIGMQHALLTAYAADVEGTNTSVLTDSECVC